MNDKHYITLIFILQASTSEMYGKVQEIPQTEKTPFYPRSPYGKIILSVMSMSHIYFSFNIVSSPYKLPYVL